MDENTIINTPIVVSSNNTESLTSLATYTIPGGTYVREYDEANVYCGTVAVTAMANSTVNGDNVVFLGNTITFVADTISDISKIITDGCGAAFYGYSKSNFNISNSTFTSNSSERQGGVAALFSSKAIFTGNTFSGNTGGDGGSIWGTNTNLTFARNQFVSNSAIGYMAGTQMGGDGGAVCAQGGTATVDDSFFSQNMASIDGGAIEASNAIVTGSTFTGNVARQHGGAINAGTSLAVTDGEFRSNTASSQGGAVNMGNSASQFNATATIFDGNKAANGGAVFLKGSNSKSATYDTYKVNNLFVNCTIQNNYASNNGGGVILDNTKACFQADTCSFEGNTAGASGGAFYMGSSNAKAMLNSCTVRGNAALSTNMNLNSGGGGVYNAAGLLVADKTTFSKNTSFKYGGGVLNQGTSAQKDAISLITDCLFTENTAVNGGAIANLDGNGHRGTVSVAGSTFTSNFATNGGGAVYNGLYQAYCPLFSSTNSRYDGNTAGNGAGVYNNSNSIAESAGDIFQNNVATGNGGAVNNSGTFTSSTSTYSVNEANSNGGAICNTQIATSTADIFDKNTAKTYGGAVYNGETATMYISGATFTENTAKEGGAIYNDKNGVKAGVVHISGSTFATASDSIKNNGQIYFSGMNVLNAVLDGSGLSHSEADATVIKGAGTVGQTYAADGFETTFGAADSGMNIDATIIGGGIASIADDAKLHFVNATMTTASIVYGAGVAAAGETYTADSVAVDFTGTGMGAKALVCAGGKGAAGAAIEVGSITITSDASGDMGILYGGADLTDGGSFEATEITTTISGSGNYLSFVGNGCKNGNKAEGTITTKIGTSTVIISGGTFENLVYGGAYAAGDNVTCGTANLSISGGTFNFSVYGGNGGKSTATTAGDKSVVGTVNVTIDVTGGNTVVFNRHLSSGSFGDGRVSNGTHMTFTGDGANLSFGADSYVSGHSQNAYHFSASNIETFVNGSSFLTFDSFTGEFKGSLSNGFTNVSFSSDSSVILKGTVESDLRYTSVWNLAVGSATDTLLDWSEANNAKNSFAGDTINLSFDSGYTLSGSKVLMNFGSDASLLTGWDSDATTVTLGGGTMSYDSTNKYYSDGSYKLYVDTTSGNKLMLASL